VARFIPGYSIQDDFTNHHLAQPVQVRQAMSRDLAWFGQLHGVRLKLLDRANPGIARTALASLALG
jgi:hypothetical protein